MNGWDWIVFWQELPLTLVGVCLELFGLWACWHARDKALFTGFMLANLIISASFANNVVMWAGVPTIPGQMPMVYAMLTLGLCWATLGPKETYKVWRASVLCLLFFYLWTHRFEMQPDISGYDTAEHYRRVVEQDNFAPITVLCSVIYIGAPLQLLWNKLQHQPPWIAYSLTMLIASLFGAIEFTTVAVTRLEVSPSWVELATSVFIFRLWMVAMGLPFVIGLIHRDHVKGTNDKATIT